MSSIGVLEIICLFAIIFDLFFFYNFSIISSFFFQCCFINYSQYYTGRVHKRMWWNLLSYMFTSIWTSTGLQLHFVARCIMVVAATYYWALGIIRNVWTTIGIISFALIKFKQNWTQNPITIKLLYCNKYPPPPLTNMDWTKPQEGRREME